MIWQGSLRNVFTSMRYIRNGDLNLYHRVNFVDFIG